MKGKIQGENKANLKIEFSSSEEKKIDSVIEVIIRGGKPLSLPVNAQAIVPNVYIKEPEIDFGGVTYKCSSVKPLTIINESPI